MADVASSYDLEHLKKGGLVIDHTHSKKVYLAVHKAYKGQMEEDDGH